MKTLEKKIVLVTGASSGLGKALSNRAAQLGAHVLTAARSLKNLQEAADEFNNNHSVGKITPVKSDIRDPKSVALLFEKIDEAGEVDMVINNAAIGHNNEIHEISVSELQDVVETNLLGSIYVTRESVRRMVEQKYGQIAYVSSLAGKMAFPNLSVYSATKYAIEGLAEATREELKEIGISVTVVRPGIVDTNFFHNAKMTEFAKLMKGKMQSPDYVADEALKGIARKSNEVTIGLDKRFMPLLKHLPVSVARRLLPLIT